MENFNIGWVKVNRKITEWEFYQDGNTYRLFLHCIYSANYTDKKWQGITIERGQFVTSYQSLATELSLSIQQIRTSIKKLEKAENITCKTTNKFTIITVINYNTYQNDILEDNTQDNKQITNKQQTNNKQITTTKEYKKERRKELEEKNIQKKNFVKPTIPEIAEYCLKRKNQVNANKFFDFYESKGWFVGKTKMKDWKACVRTWENNGKEQLNAFKPTPDGCGERF
jgi:hypothetical protein